MSRGVAAARRSSVGASPRLPRRVSGPAPVRVRPRSAKASPTIARRLGRSVLELPDHRLLDRLIRGRGWIALLAFALIGIVAMQVSLLKLNTGIGRAVQSTSVLERENAALRAQVSRMASGDRIEGVARRLGLVMAPAGAVRFLAARPQVDPSRAGAMIASTTPSPSPDTVTGGRTSSAVSSGPAAGRHAVAPGLHGPRVAVAGLRGPRAPVPAAPGARAVLRQRPRRPSNSAPRSPRIGQPPGLRHPIVHRAVPRSLGDGGARVRVTGARR